MEKRLRLDAKRQIRGENPRQHLDARLDRAFRPAVLLRLEGVHLDRYFSGCDQIRQEDEAPPAQLGAVTEIEIFRDGVVLPSAAVDDGGAPPDARCAVEVEEVP